MSILNPENLCITRSHSLFGKTIKQPLSNFEPPNLENISSFGDLGVALVAYKK